MCSLWALTAQHLQGAEWRSSQVFRLLPLPVSLLTHPRKKVLVTPCVSCFVVSKADQKLFGERAQTGLLRAFQQVGE